MTNDELNALLETSAKSVLESWADKRQAKAFQTFLSHNPSTAALKEETEKRLVRIQEAYESKLNASKLEMVMLEKCVEMDVPYKTVRALGFTFSDEADIVAKLTAFKSHIGALKDDAIIQQRASSAKPGSGTSPPEAKRDLRFYMAERESRM